MNTPKITLEIDNIFDPPYKIIKSNRVDIPAGNIEFRAVGQRLTRPRVQHLQDIKWDVTIIPAK